MMWDNTGVHMSVPFNQATLAAPWFNKINWTTEVKLMIRELTLLFSARVHGNWSLPGTLTFQWRTRPHSSQQLSPYMTFIPGSDIKYDGEMHLFSFFFLQTAVDSRLHRYWVHTLRGADIHTIELCDLFWKMGSCRKHECIPEGLKPTIFWCQAAS